MSSIPQAGAPAVPVPGWHGALDRYFKISERGSNVATEVRGGIVSYVVLRLLLGRTKEIHPIAGLLTLLLVIYYATLGGH